MNKVFIVLGILSCLVLSCSKDDGDSEKQNSSSSQDLDGFIRGMDDPIQESVGKEQIGDVLTEIDKETNTYCECTKYKASEEFNEVMLLDPTSSVIYPGSIIEGNSVLDGSYRQIVLDRAPMNISTNFQNFTGSAKRTVEDPTLSNVRSEIKKMLYDSDINGSTPAKMTFSIEEVYSEDQLDLAIGASVKYSGQKISSGFNFNSKEIRSRFLVKFIQVYYTVDVDAPSSPSKFFAENVTSEDLRRAVGGGNTVPVYVSTVQYGRVAYYTMESSENSDSVRQISKLKLKQDLQI